MHFDYGLEDRSQRILASAGPFIAFARIGPTVEMCLIIPDWYITEQIKQM